MLREQILRLINRSLIVLQRQGVFSAWERLPQITVEPPSNPSYGDYSTNIPLVMARLTQSDPMEIAEKLGETLRQQGKNLFKKVETVKPGFINFFFAEEYFQKQIAEILKPKEKFGKINIGKNKKVNVEFISANPTGPLTLGNGRGGFCGDVLANVLEKAGYTVTREYYVNDRGEQVIKLGHSILEDSQAVYRGPYIATLKKKLGGKTSQCSVEEVGKKAAKIVLEKMIKPTIKKTGINFDIWFSEESLYKDKSVEKILAGLKKNKLAYEKEGALWLKTSRFGDEKDRVLVKSGGEETYFASDIAYLKNKFSRGFGNLIFFWGADHHGYADRLKAAAEALGYKKEQLQIILMQLVRLFQNDEEVKMSKRTGAYITMDELLDEVGLDVARFFFLARSSDTHLNFDLNLAKEQSQKNPVYYVQYAYARICSILKKVKSQKSKVKTTTQNLKLLNSSEELELIKQLIRLPEVVEDTAGDYQIQRLPQYAMDLTSSFHKFYENCRVINDDKDLTQARLALVLATKIVLKNTLDLIGISSPEKM